MVMVISDWKDNNTVVSTHPIDTDTSMVSTEDASPLIGYLGYPRELWFDDFATANYLTKTAVEIEASARYSVKVALAISAMLAFNVKKAVTEVLGSINYGVVKDLNACSTQVNYNIVQDLAIIPSEILYSVYLPMFVYSWDSADSQVDTYAMDSTYSMDDTLFGGTLIGYMGYPFNVNQSAPGNQVNYAVKQAMSISASASYNVATLIADVLSSASYKVKTALDVSTTASYKVKAAVALLCSAAYAVATNLAVSNKILYAVASNYIGWTDYAAPSTTWTTDTQSTEWTGGDVLISKATVEV